MILTYKLRYDNKPLMLFFALECDNPLYSKDTESSINFFHFLPLLEYLNCQDFISLTPKLVFVLVCDNLI